MNSPLRNILQNITARDECTDELIKWSDTRHRQPGIMTSELHQELLDKIRELEINGATWCRHNNVDYGYFRKLKSGERWKIGKDALDIFNKLGIRWLEFVACIHHKPYNPVWTREGKFYRCNICGEKKEVS